MIGYTRDDNMGLDRDRHVKVITVCHNVADSLDEGVGRDAIIIGFSMAANETGGLGGGFEGSRLGKGITCRSYARGKSRWATIQRRQSNLKCSARECFGPTTISIIRQ
jgi:hypothetical protein